jgi:DNA-binding PadR family transcriptional regulator
LSKEYDVSTLLVLGLIAERSRHAYEVEACINERNFRHWTAIGFSSIYALLDRLEREGLLESARETVDKRPARRVYSPTPVGLAHLQGGIMHLLEQPTVHRSPICVALALSAGCPPRDLIEPLEGLAQNAAAALTDLDAREQEARSRWWTPALAAIFDHDRALIEAEAAWARGTARTFAEAGSEPPSWPDWDS